MIDEVDESLCALIRQQALNGSDVDVVQATTKDWRAVTATAYLAAEEGSSLRLEHCIRGVELEYWKPGPSPSPRRSAPYFSLLAVARVSRTRNSSDVNGITRP